jgi:hypothetical protein
MVSVCLRCCRTSFGKVFVQEFLGNNFAETYCFQYVEVHKCWKVFLVDNLCALARALYALCIIYELVTELTLNASLNTSRAKLQPSESIWDTCYVEVEEQHRNCHFAPMYLTCLYCNRRLGKIVDLHIAQKTREQKTVVLPHWTVYLSCKSYSTHVKVRKRARTSNKCLYLTLTLV